MNCFYNHLFLKGIPEVENKDMARICLSIIVQKHTDFRYT
jgi:hypothetical protein